MTIRLSLASTVAATALSCVMAAAQVTPASYIPPKVVAAVPSMQVAGVLREFTAVKGLPYTRRATTTTVNTMDNGTPMTSVRMSLSMRDSEGRTRIEQGLKVGEVFVPEHIMITDPGARFQANFDTVSRTGTVSYLRVPKVRTPEEEAALAERKAQSQKEREAREASDPERKPLGSRMVAGVTADGLRFSTIIQVMAQESATGRRDVRLVLERWWSPALKVELDSTTEDPRGQKTTTVVTSLETVEPAEALFKSPEGYTVTVHGKP